MQKSRINKFMSVGFLGSMMLFSISTAREFKNDISTKQNKSAIETKQKEEVPLIEEVRLLEDLKLDKDDKFTIYDKNDVKITVGGKTSSDCYIAKNLIMLNSAIPDEIGYFKQTVDLTGRIAWGKEKFGHNALEVFNDLRAKGLWGDSGSAVNTLNDTIKLDGIDVVVGSHKHKNKKAYINLRETWFQVSLNAVFNLEHERVQFAKFGFFPFSLGRGIALGAVYGQTKDFLGISSGYNSDQFAPGIDIHGDIIKDKLSYDFYYAKLEENSDNLGKTFNFIKANHVGKSDRPWRGVDKDNDLLALRFKWKDENTKLGTLELEPYILYNEASDRKIEFEADAKSELGTAGVSLDIKKNNFECGAEGAFNFGQETAYNIDRNELAIGNSNAQVIVKYTKIVDVNGAVVNVTTANKTIVDASNNITNDSYIGTGDEALYNSATRFRPEYTNKYGGWMFVADAAYTFDEADVKIAATYGYASGDKNPHSPQNSDIEKDKTYRGFVGLQEWYTGKRVKSVIVLDARKIKRPLTIPTDERSAGDDTSFTDLQFIGAGITWFPKEHNVDRFSLTSNVLSYWKAYTAHKYDRANETTSSAEASKFLGVEWNVRLRYEVFKNFHAYGDFAIFFPGTYYNDVKGTPLRGDIYNKLDAANRTGLDPANYRLGNDTACYMNLGLFYKF